MASSKLKVASLSEIPAVGGLRLQVMGRWIALFRVGNGLRAIDDTCPHMGASLSEGELDGKRLTCPWHAWTFDLDTGCSVFSSAVKVGTYPVVLEGGQVFVEWPD